MIDLHSHILPGLDDGSAAMEDTLAIARQLSDAGFHTVIATPHVLDGGVFLPREEILASVERVQEALRSAKIPLEIYPGSEVYIFPDLARWVMNGKIMTINNSQYLLLELPLMEVPTYTEQVFFDLQVNGITPVLAHPERYERLIREPQILCEWGRKGVLFQVNIRSIGGRYGRHAREMARSMLASGLVHFLGSDAHRPLREPSLYTEELRMIMALTGESAFRDLVFENPFKVLQGEPVPFSEEYIFRPAAGERKPFWRRIFT